MSNSNKIELLTMELLDDEVKLEKIDHWLRVMNRPQGWHYDMDIIWLLKGLEDAGINRGATILDAGAGMGVTQFILAASGYNVISLDFTPRAFPNMARGIFDIKIEEQDNLDYKHNYMSYIKYGDGQYIKEKSNPIKVCKKAFLALIKGPGYVMSRLNVQFRKIRNKCYFNVLEKTNDHSDFGNIRFIRAPFHKIPLKDQEVDALVSVSAIEHADKKLMENNILEMKRVVKKDLPLFITTSATSEKEDIFLDEYQTWCFTENSINNFTGGITESIFDYNMAERNILDSELWRKRIDPYYADNPSSIFFKRKVKHLPYLPVGIKIISD